MPNGAGLPGGARGWPWGELQPPLSAHYTGRAWAMARAAEVAVGPAAGLGPRPAVGVQGAVLVPGSLWDKRVFKRFLPAVRGQKGS